MTDVSRERTIERGREVGALPASAPERPLEPAAISADRAEELIDAVR